MRVAIKINDANVVHYEKSLILDSALSPRKSTVVFDVEGEERLATPSLAISRSPAIGGYTLPELKHEVKIDRGAAPFESCAIGSVIALGGNSTYIDHFFGGYIASIETRLIGIRRFYHCTAQDYQARLASILIDKSYTGQTEQEIIDALFSTYWPEIDTSTHVTGTETITSIQFPRIMLDEALNQLADINGRKWYIDHEKKLHYASPSDAADAPFTLSDSPYLSTRIGYFNFKYLEDASKLINRITVIGEINKNYDVSVAKYFDGATFTDYTSEVTDGDSTTHMPADGMTTAHYILLGMDERFSAVIIQMGSNKNANASVMSAEYTKGAGAWGALTITDETADGGATLAKQGKVSFTPPNDWVKDTVDGIEKHYIRLKVSATLSATVDIAEIDATNYIITTRQDDDSYAQWGEWYDDKYVDHNINTVAWAELMGDAILAESAFKKKTGSLVCGQEGLVVGQKVNIVNSSRNIDDDFLVQTLRLSMIGGLTPEIQVGFGDYYPNLVSLLSAINVLQRKEN